MPVVGAPAMRKTKTVSTKTAVVSASWTTTAVPIGPVR
jgi:hypothetical protein